MRRVTLVVVLLALTGCVSLPESGPVSSTADATTSAPAGTFDYQPEQPEPGDEPASIVRGFLDSLRETPLTYSVARSYLTAAASSAWAPNQRTIVYDDGSLSTTVTGGRATVSLGSAVQLDSRGSWLGDLSGGRGLEFELDLVQEDGEWRIADPPDALVISRTHFDSRFVRYDLHFFDPSGQILVAEPVYLPAGDTTPYLLVSGLLAGPRPSLQAVERTYFPLGTRLERAVPPAGGVIDVPLSEEILETDTAQLDLAMAQLAWTLRQIPGIEQMRVTVDGEPVDRATGASARSVLGWSSYDPSAAGADSALYAVLGTELVIDDGDGLQVLSSPFRRNTVRSVGISLGVSDETQLAAVTSDGQRLLSAPVQGEQPRLRYDGVDLLRPAYDRFDHLWALDRTAGGARLLVGPRNGRLRTVTVPGLTGEQVSAFELSRDGTRLAAIVDDRVVLARISRSETGRPTDAGPAVTLPFGGPGSTGRAVDLAWTSPDTVGVLVRLGPNISQVLLAGVDGSSAIDAEASSLEPLFERVVDLTTWPGPDAPVLLRTRAGDFYEVSSTGQWTSSDLPRDLVGPTFPG